MPILHDFEDVIISSASIEKTTRSLQGSSGASGTDSEHWQTVLLRHGAPSSHLRDEVATLATKCAIKSYHAHENVQSNLTMVESASTGFWKVDCA